MKAVLLIATFTALFTFTVQAGAPFTFSPKANNTVGLFLGGEIWKSEANGSFGEQNTLIDFNLYKEQQGNYFIAIVHPYPLLPNVRISNTKLNTTGKTTLSKAFSFGDEAFSIGDDVTANFNVSYTDYTLYYELFNNDLLSFDFGLTARDFNGGVTVTGPTIIDYGDGNCSDPDPGPDITCPAPSSNITPTGEIKTDEIMPMLYVATNVSLPLRRLSIYAQGDFLLTEEHSLYDFQAGFNYGLVDNTIGKFHLTLGYRVVNMKFEDLDDLYTDLKFKGVSVGIIIHF
jgi:hypothetical protein